MATLKDRLAAIKKGFAAKAPESAQAIMARATKELQDSGQAGRAVGEGQVFPDFTLADARGNQVSSQQLRGQGPMVLTVFRGHW